MISIVKISGRLFLFLSLQLFSIGCNDESKKSIENNNDAASTTPIINYAVTKVFPHDTSLFTEGFLVHNGQLFESTGSPENLTHTRSLIGTIDLKTGKLAKKIELDRSKYFGEGIVILKDKLYQLTYKNHVGFIYNLKSFKQIDSFHFSNQEGWGLTTNGSELIMSDGTENLSFMTAGNIKTVRTLTVIESGIPVDYLNELEYINGFIYANVWKTNFILKINPASGKVIGKLDLSSLVSEAMNKNPNADVLNGIAYDANSNAIYVTGKLWSNIYQINFAH
ncbi:MAG TPA: glutaminyl-peptide cyclotransferase [Lacibacter sp.]|jgi:glutamine cyclotransferase|nr:glutaminyl-peptide cyclotransferase [Lacibacter sp.]